MEKKKYQPCGIIPRVIIEIANFKPEEAMKALRGNACVDLLFF